MSVLSECELRVVSDNFVRRSIFLTICFHPTLLIIISGVLGFLE